MSTVTATLEASETTKSMGQTYYEDVEELKTSGVPNAEAIRQVAEKYSKPVGSVRGGIHQYKVRWIASNNGGQSQRRRSAASVDDLVGQARQSVESALALIDNEVEGARAQYDAAKQRYEQVQASVGERKTDLLKKLKALS